MLYSIIPPVLMLLSLVGIIIFLVKKAPAVSGIKRESDGSEKREAKKKFFGKLMPVRNKTQIDRNDPQGVQNELAAVEDETRPLAEEKKVSWLSKKLKKGSSKKAPEIIEEKTETPFLKRQEEEPAVGGQEYPVFQRRRGEAVHAKENLNFDLNLKNVSSADTEITSPSAKEKIEKKDLFEKILIDRIASNPKDIEAYERLGEYYMEIENWNYAKECFKQVIKLHPGSIKARMKMRKLGRLLAR